MLVKDFANTAGHFHRIQKFLLLFVGTHGGIPHRARPNRSNERADVKALALDEVSYSLELVITCLGVGMGQKKKVVDAIELSAVDLGGGGKVEHVLETDGGFLSFVVAFANETGPHCIMKFEG